jgi:hypothetical protein
MIVHIDGVGRLSLSDAADFRKFKVVVGAAESHYGTIAPHTGPAVVFDDAGTAWVSIASLRALDGLADDKGWQDGLTAMIDKARPHGWISAAGDAIKAHVEWAG